WSPDGKWVAFDYHPGAHAQIYLVDSEGRNLHVLTSGNYENQVPSWSHDGKTVYFASDRTGDWQVWKHELSTGTETQITQHGGFAAFESYDARTLYYSKYRGGGIWKIPCGRGARGTHNRFFAPGILGPFCRDRQWPLPRRFRCKGWPRNHVL